MVHTLLYSNILHPLCHHENVDITTTEYHSHIVTSMRVSLAEVRAHGHCYANSDTWFNANLWAFPDHLCSPQYVFFCHRINIVNQIMHNGPSVVTKCGHETISRVWILSCPFCGLMLAQLDVLAPRYRYGPCNPCMMEVGDITNRKQPTENMTTTQECSWL